MTFIIAIDGAAGSGKGTIARGISKKFNFSYFDTGIIYRGLALKTINKYGEGFTNLNAISEANVFDINSVNESEIRNPIIDKYSSIIASIPDVRKIVVNIQRSFKEQSKEHKGIVVDGRDIGTVVFPKAELKFFLEATMELRAKRRFDELFLNDKNITYSEVLNNIKLRDNQDANRKHSPLKKAEDALLINTDNLTLDELELKLLSYINPIITKNL